MLQYARSLWNTVFPRKRSLDVDTTSSQEDDDSSITSRSKKIKTDESNNDTKQFVHRLRVQNLPQRDHMKKIKTFFKDHGMPRVKKIPNQTEAYVSFDTEEEAKAALKKFDDLLYKGSKLSATYQKTLAEDFHNRHVKKNKGKQEEMDKLPLPEQLALQATPLYRLEYKQQLEKKNNICRAQLRKLKRELIYQTKDAVPGKKLSWIKTKNEYADTEEPIASPQIDGYRNKCEFTIGKDPEGEPSVGFRLGAFRHGICTVHSPEPCLNVPDVMKRIANGMQAYVRSSPYEVFDQVTKKGVWRIIMTRALSTEDVMVLIQIQATDLTPEQLEEEKEKLKAYWSGLKNAPANEKVVVTTLLLQVWDGIADGLRFDIPSEPLIGDGYVYENLLGCKFRISGDSFFQVNTKAAEVLYSKCAEWCQVSDKTTLLDLCCGTGTIGLTMAKHVKEVIGIEMVPEAIEDARYNAELNDITNTTFYTGKIEDRLNVLTQVQGDDIVAVLDPPRGGIPSSVIRSIREVDAIDRVVYISCDIEKAFTNLMDLCRPMSKRFKGRSFKPKRCVVIDLFPHTAHFETVIEFVRVSDSDIE